MAGRPRTGLGQLLFYKGAIEANFEEFLSTLRQKLKEELEGKQPESASKTIESARTSSVKYQLYLKKTTTDREKGEENP